MPSCTTYLADIFGYGWILLQFLYCWRNPYYSSFYFFHLACWFKNVKGLLYTSQVFADPNFTKLFKLEVDASIVGARTVSEHNVGGLDHSVFSHKFLTNLNITTQRERDTVIVTSITIFWWICPSLFILNITH